MTATPTTTSRTTGWLSSADCSIDDFAAVVERTTHLADYPHADAVERNVLIYGEKLRAAVGDTAGRSGGAGRADAGTDRRAGHRGVQAGLR